MAIGKNPTDQVDKFLNMVDKASNRPAGMDDGLKKHKATMAAIQKSPGVSPAAIRGKTMHQAVMDELDSSMPWNSKYGASGKLPEITFYVYKEDEHTGRVVFGDEQAMAYDKLIAFTETLNAAMAARYPDVYYTTEDVYRVAQTHVSPWGQAEHLGYKDALWNCSVGPDFWQIIGQLGNFQPNWFKLSNLVVPDTEARSGRTNKIAIDYCQKLLAEPNRWFNILDHYNKPESNMRVAKQIQKILEGMGLRVHLHEYKNHRDYSTRVDVKLEVTGSNIIRKDTICNPRTKSTPET